MWNEMTDIDAFHIVCDARSMSNKGTQNAFHRWDAKSIVIDARFLEGGGDYYIDKKGVMTNDYVHTEEVLTYEIGHNVFYNWYFSEMAGKEFFKYWFSLSKTTAPLNLSGMSNTIIEGFANLFVFHLDNINPPNNGTLLFRNKINYGYSYNSRGFNEYLKLKMRK